MYVHRNVSLFDTTTLLNPSAGDQTTSGEPSGSGTNTDTKNMETMEVPVEMSTSKTNEIPDKDDMDQTECDDQMNACPENYVPITSENYSLRKFKLNEYKDVYNYWFWLQWFSFNTHLCKCTSHIFFFSSCLYLWFLKLFFSLLCIETEWFF